MLENIRNQLFSIFLVTVLFLVTTMLFLFLTDPAELPLVMLVLFYLSLSAFVFCFFTLVMFALRRQNMVIAMRQALWLTVFITASLIMASQQLLYWWLESALVLTLILIEGFFLVSNNNLK